MTIKVRINGSRFCQLKKHDHEKWEKAIRDIEQFKEEYGRKPTKNERKALIGNVRARELHKYRVYKTHHSC